jgi:hypothetical protein
MLFLHSGGVAPTFVGAILHLCKGAYTFVVAILDSMLDLF